MKILIVGGGVAGSVLAGCLKKRSINDITLIEQTPAFHHIGFLIGLWPNGRSVLKFLGIDQIAERNGYEVEEEFINNDRGQPLASFPLVLGRELARPVTISRADLHEGLV